MLALLPTTFQLLPLWGSRQGWSLSRGTGPRKSVRKMITFGNNKELARRWFARLSCVLGGTGTQVLGGWGQPLGSFWTTQPQGSPWLCPGQPPGPGPGPDPAPSAWLSAFPGDGAQLQPLD